MTHKKSKFTKLDLPIQGPQMPFHIHAVLNMIDGIIPVRLIGHNDASSASFEDIWDLGGTYPEVTTSETLSIVSSSIEDAAGGTGTSSVTVYGLDSAGALQEETVTMTGQTPVLTTNTFSFVHDMQANDVGSSLFNVGQITATNTTSSQVIGVIEALEGRMHSTIYRVPTGYYLSPQTITAGGAKGDAHLIDFLCRESAGDSWRIQWRVELYETTIGVDLNHGLLCPPGATIRARSKLIVAGGSAAVTANITGYLIHEKYYNTA